MKERDIGQLTRDIYLKKPKTHSSRHLHNKSGSFLVSPRETLNPGVRIFPAPWLQLKNANIQGNMSGSFIKELHSQIKKKKRKELHSQKLDNLTVSSNKQTTHTAQQWLFFSCQLFSKVTF